jgi:hypothetical protein
VRPSSGSITINKQNLVHISRRSSGIACCAARYRNFSARTIQAKDNPRACVLSYRGV